jgi:hypothetical protein
MHPLLALTKLTVNVAILDAGASIVGVNSAWRDFARAGGLQVPDYGIGRSYLDYCGNDGNAERLRRDLQHLISGHKDIVTVTYPCHSPDQMRWCLMIGLPLSRGEPAGAAVLHINLTDLLPVVFSVPELRSAPGQLSSSDSVITLELIADVVRNSVRETMMAGMSAAPRSADTAVVSPADERRFAGLTTRQRQVFALIGEGKSNVEDRKSVV